MTWAVISFFIGLSGGTALGYLFLKRMLPPLLSRTLKVRESYYKLKVELVELKERIKDERISREDLTNEIDEFLSEDGD